MRPTLLIIGSIVLIAIAFTAYILLQTPPPKGGVQFEPIAAPPPPNTDDVDTQTLHPGTAAFMKSYDSKTHQLANQFRADTYDPKPDGTIDMTNPEAEFFLGGGQMLRINGETGNVVDPNSAGGKLQGQSQTPSRGKMQHVVLRLFKAVNDKLPQFTCYVNNLAFDNDTTRIATEDCDIPDMQGNLVHTPADQVPVHVVGIDYDFDGRGLTIKWNERDRHLERLEIAHGEQLIIKHPNGLNAQARPTTAPATPLAQTIGLRSQGALCDADGPIALVSTSPDAAGSALTETKKPATRPARRKKRRPTSKPAPPPPASAPVIHREKDAGVYRATFFDNVHVTQLGQTLATADRMNVDFFMNNGHASTQPTTRPNAHEGEADAVQGKENALDESGDQLAQSQSPAHSPRAPKRTASNSTAAPATSPSTPPDNPVIVRWTGKLIVTPPDADVPPLAAGDSVLQMIGDAAPAVLLRAGSVIHCASFRYHTLDQSVELNNSPAFPIVTVLDANGTKVFAPEVDYDGLNQTATIPGQAWAEFPVATNSGASSTTQAAKRPAQIAKADWSDSCTLVLQPGEHGDEQVTEALLDGNVHVDHPQIKLTADELDLGLDNSPRSKAQSAAPAAATQGSTAVATSGQLRSMDASGAVDCTLHDSQGKPQRIIAQHLTLATVRAADGEDVPSEVTADGKVHTFDQTQSLRSEHLVAELAPPTAGPRAAAATTTPAGDKQFGGDVQLQELTATQHVQFTANDGSFADAQRLHVQTIKQATAGAPADQEIELMGDPNARVGDKQNTVTGPIIHYNPGTKMANVIGAGTIHGVQQILGDGGQNAGRPAPTSRPVDVAWQRSFAMNGVGNHVEILGNVRTQSVSEDGTRNTATGDRVEMTLIDAPPTTAPTTAPATAPTSAPAMLVRGSDANFMKDKAVDVVTLYAKDDENVEIDSVARNQAGAIIHAMNLFATRAIYDKTHDQFRVPVPGRMLVRDFRNAGPTSAPSESSAEGMHGTSAFEWEKSLVYDQRADQAVMTGDVQVVHEAPGAASYQMYADTITVDLDPNAHATTRPTTGPVATTRPVPSGEDAMKVKRMVARGQVRMISQKLGFTAARAVYDPVTQVMTAYGSQREPAQLLDEQGLSTGSFDELIYNTRTDQVQITEFHGNMRK
jgi:lipopolysaccharide export system protein LptA